MHQLNKKCHLVWKISVDLKPVQCTGTYLESAVVIFKWKKDHDAMNIGIDAARATIAVSDMIPSSL